jgi:carboxymethylenebutenolidase
MKRIFTLSTVTLMLALPAAAQDWAREVLNKSPRHHEWVEVKHGDRVVHSFVVYPESKTKTAVVVVIHENQGLTDWVRTVADQLAANGYIAVAPDLLSGKAPGGGKTSDFPDATAARDAIRALDPALVTQDLNAVVEYAKKIPAANGKVAVGGFCWGGAQTFRFATNNKDIAAAFVFYGTSPEDVAGVTAPVYGFYGGNDERVNATIPKSKEMMAAAGKKYDPVIYEGAGHGFMRSGMQPDATEPNKKAREESWQRWLELLKAL